MGAQDHSEIQARKLRHIEACLLPGSQYASVTAGFESVSWPYRALPELDLNHIDLSTELFGKRLSAPLLIGAMTGGAARARTINRHLAEAAERLGVGMMLGSQRVMLEQPEAAASFQVRDLAPSILLIGNLGAAQFRQGYTERHIVQAIEEIGADALAIHVNPLQEAVQRGGDTQWAGLADRLCEVVPRTPYPVMLKEVGHGLDARTVRRVRAAGFAAFDVAGAGGTSWARVEQLVHHGAVIAPDLCELGLPTVQALRDIREAAPGVPLIASGGVRSGLDAAKALGLGAQVVALARPLLESALEGPDAAEAVLTRLIGELRAALFVAGFGSVQAARGALLT